VQAVLGLASGRLFAVVITLAFTGLRIGELIALRPEDVDFVAGWIRVRPRDGWRPKTEHSERDVPVHPRLTAILKAVEKGKGDYFFTAAPSTRFPLGDHHLNDRMVNHQFKDLAKICGFSIGRDKQGLTVHALRRFFKTYTLDAGVPKPLVDQWMGHLNLSGMDSFYYDSPVAKNWMERVPFGGPNEDDLKRLKGGDQ
jgi:integrase